MGYIVAKYVKPLMQMLTMELKDWQNSNGRRRRQRRTGASKNKMCARTIPNDNTVHVTLRWEVPRATAKHKCEQVFELEGSRPSKSSSNFHVVMAFS